MTGTLQHIYIFRIEEIYSRNIASNKVIDAVYRCPRSGYYSLTFSGWNNGIATNNIKITSNNTLPVATCMQSGVQMGCTVSNYFDINTQLQLHAEWSNTGNYTVNCRLHGFCIAV